MRTHLRIGRIAGIPIGLNISVLFMGVALWFVLANTTLPATVPGLSAGAYWFAATIGVLVFMASLIVHELGHALVAQRNDVAVSEIVLWLFGGVAKLESEADDPRTEFRIAAAGPAGSALCAVVLALPGWWWEPPNPLLVSVARGMAIINVGLCLFNLLPGLPLDGGRILRAVLWRRSAKLPATRRAARIGRILAIAFIIGGGIELATGRLTGLWTIGIGLFLLWAATSEQREVAVRPELVDLPATSLMRPLPEPLVAWDTLADFERRIEATPTHGEQVFPVHDGFQRQLGWLVPDVLYRVPPRQRHLVPVESYVVPVAQMPTVAPDDTVGAIAERLGRSPRSLAVVTDGGRPLGLLRATDLERVLELTVDPALAVR